MSRILRAFGTWNLDVKVFDFWISLLLVWRPLLLIEGLQWRRSFLLLDILTNLITTARLVGIPVSLACLFANSLTCSLARRVALQAWLAAWVGAGLAISVHFFCLLQGRALLGALVLEFVLVLLFFQVIFYNIINLFSAGAKSSFLEWLYWTFHRAFHRALVTFSARLSFQHMPASLSRAKIWALVHRALALLGAWPLAFLVNDVAIAIHLGFCCVRPSTNHLLGRYLASTMSTWWRLRHTLRQLIRLWRHALVQLTWLWLWHALLQSVRWNRLTLVPSHVLLHETSAEDCLF